eukprot:CAMPEP_0181309498 /NCGR_PEP_ID=MMETSP1101-20121128/12045_1 /TAXON_ID=46948 /ORGANISM="Rhodomonas abbreviata, Strain Caron Lab Isolate" /LENGTH=98 /DNA_ID=CAMNT_0023415985 /DNA_START=383 /DNA_END=676 /DNA_ORIENTATION=+
MRPAVIRWGMMMLLLPIFGSMIVAQPGNTSSSKDFTEAQQMNLLLAEMRQRFDQKQISFETMVALTLQISQMKADHARERREEARLAWEKEEKEKEVQ